MLRGCYTTRIDDKGRLKLPTVFRSKVVEQYGTSLYVTSVRGDSVLIYPMPIWEAIEQRVARTPSTHPSLGRFTDRISYFGQETEIDSQGRILLSQRLRGSAAMQAEVDVLGKMNFLEVWNHDRFETKLQREPYTDDDARALAELGL